MPDLPNALSLSTIAGKITAAPHNNNYTAIQTAVNALRTLFAGGSSGQVLRATDSDTVAYAYPPGYEYAYVEFTANVTVTATSEATADTVVSAGSVTFDGSTAVVISFESNRVDRGTTSTTLVLFDGSTAIGVLGQSTAVGGDPPFVRSRRLTPSAAAHTYSVRAYVDAGSGTVVGNAGGAATNLPGFIKITKA